jgi:hypothetical protein
MAEVEIELRQPGWRLPSVLIEQVDRAYHQRKAAGTYLRSKQEFVADLLIEALQSEKDAQRRSRRAQAGS